MSCPSEGTWAAYADGELPRAQTSEVERHLDGCPRCRQLVLGLRDENRLLSEILEEAAPLAAEPTSGIPSVALGGLAALVVTSLGLQALWSWIAGLGRESPLGPLDGRSVVLGMLSDAVFYVLGEGASMLESILSTFVVLGLIALGGVLALSLRKRWFAGALTLSAVLALAESTSALETRGARGEHDRVLVRSGEILDDSLLAAGDTVAVDGTVTGNLIAAGRRVILRGTVKGDLVAVARRVEVEGTVEGNVFAGGNTLVIRGPVGRSAYLAGEQLRVDSPGRVDGDLLAVGTDLGIDGRVGRDLAAACGVTNLEGEVGRNASIRTGALHVEAPARIGGRLVVGVKHAADVRVEPGATVSGGTETRVRPPEKSRYLRPGFYLWRLIWLAAAFLTGLVLKVVLPGLFPPRLLEGAAILRAIGLGFVALLVVPAGAILLVVTLVGLPIGLITLALWLAGLYVAQILAATLVGRGLLQRADAPPASFAPVLLVGLLTVAVAVNLPFVGGLLRLVVLLLGLGLIVLRGRRGVVTAAA